MKAEETEKGARSEGSVNRWIERTEAYTREKPARAVSAAVGVGILLTIFPFGSLLAALLRILMLLLRPLLLILGLVKLFEEVEARRSKSEPPQH